MKTVDGLDLPATLDEWADPARTALLVYDMQIGICRQVESTVIIANVQRVLAVARAAGMRTIFTRHLSLPRKLMGRMAYRTAMAWQRTDDPDAVEPWFLRDSPGFAITPELTPRADEAVFDKITMSAFEGTPLAITLRDCGIQALAICGIAMEIGIEPTVRHAADLGIVPIVIADACGHGDAEAARRSLDQMRFTGDAIVTDVAGFSAALSA
ncbi:cysteine hydrolase [Sphingomonas asaccharolytica]|uniref:cysteine hydrolase n=1 Tax=Sphingomonas asaccharolytica TaxID=40681 RepID=UPI00082FCBB7|nr:cysteine hydrolase [Sphingomonas asaccharolytica]